MEILHFRYLVKSRYGNSAFPLFGEIPLGHVNLIVSFPSGPQPGNRPSLPPEKKTGPKKQTAAGRKKQMPPLHGASLPPARKKTNAPSKEKYTTKGKSPYGPTHGARRQLFSPPGWLPIQAPPRKSSLPPARKKNRPRKTNLRGTKKTNYHLFFFPPPDGKLTIKFTCP